MSGQERGACGRELSVGYNIEFQVSSLYLRGCMFQRDGSLDVLRNLAGCIFCCVISSTGMLFIQMPWLTFSGGLILPRSATQFTLCMCGGVCLCAGGWVDYPTASMATSQEKPPFMTACMCISLCTHALCFIFFLSMSI